MSLSPVEQGLEFGLALLLGGGLGLVYDVLRVVRGRVPFRMVTFLMDILFWLISAIGAFWFAMSVSGGALHLFTMAGMVGGAALYFVLLSRFVRALGFAAADGLAWMLRQIFRPVRAVVRGGERVSEKSKKVFALAEKKNRLKNVSGEIRAAQRRVAREGEFGNEKASEDSFYPSGRGMVGGDAAPAPGTHQRGERREKRDAGIRTGEGDARRRPSGGYRL